MISIARWRRGACATLLLGASLGTASACGSFGAADVTPDPNGIDAALDAPGSDAAPGSDGAPSLDGAPGDAAGMACLPEAIVDDFERNVVDGPGWTVSSGNGRASLQIASSGAATTQHLRVDVLGAAAGGTAPAELSRPLGSACVEFSFAILVDGPVANSPVQVFRIHGTPQFVEGSQRTPLLLGSLLGRNLSIVEVLDDGSQFTNLATLQLPNPAGWATVRLAYTETGSLSLWKDDKPVPVLQTTLVPGKLATLRIGATSFTGEASGRFFFDDVSLR